MIPPGAVAIGVGAYLLAKGRGRVLARERADGVHPELKALLDAWEHEGTHVVVVAGGPTWPYSGGLRTDEEQSAAHAGGLSNASNLKDTPHGRGAALDIWPAGFNPNADFTAQPHMRALMADFGTWAESYGLVWGGRWKTATWPDGDMAHVELKNWRSLPYPPPDYGAA